MSAATAVLPRLATRVRGGVRRSENWWQGARFLAVGASGFVINTLVFGILVHALGVDYRLAAVVSNSIALTNNFLWNRHWTFRAGHERATLQAPRFVLVSAIGFVVNFIVLQVAVEMFAAPPVLAAVIASAVAAPVNFLGSRQWAFRRV